MATVKNIRLEDITLEYNSFVDSQVLTHTQLNEIIEFFEDQQRLTRTCLVGVGLVCGLSIKGDVSGIKISKGCAVTTDGDLLYLNEAVYKNFRAYDNQQIQYPPFYPQGTDKPQMPLWELVLPDAKTGKLPENSFSLNDFKTKSGSDLEKAVALLYLEYFEKEPDACTAIDCDNQGKKQVAKPKLLLLTPANMQQIIDRTADEIVADDLFKMYNNAYNTYFDTATVYSKRALINPKLVNSGSDLAASYLTVVKNNIGVLGTAIDKLYSAFSFALDSTSYWNISTLKGKLTGISGLVITIEKAQYYYDFYKDLVAGYNELREILSNIVFQCCPNVYAFPKHIMLGYLNGPAGPEPPDYRHQFYPSPAVSKNKVTLNVAKSMMERLFSMILNFDIPVGVPVKITPSSDPSRLTEDRAIPFYYKNPGILADKWNYGNSLRGTARQVLSYRSPDYAAGNDPVVNPLNYDINSYNFFRIEGHIGKSYTQALSDINKLKTDYNLAFDLIALKIGNVKIEDIDLEDYQCLFEDLEVIYQAWKAEQECLYAGISKFFSGFRTDSKTPAHIDYYIPLLTEKMRLSDINTTSSEAQINRKSAEKSNFREAAESPSFAAEAGFVNYYKPDVTIERNIQKTEGTLGKYLDNASFIDFISAPDLINKIAPALEAVKVIGADRDVTITIPLSIIAYAKGVTSTIPSTLVGVADETISNYKSHMEDLCAQVDSARKTVSKIFGTSGYERKGYEEQYQMMLWQVAENCCSGKKLDLLLDEINNRKQQVLENLTFSKYAAQHPGIEHKAGVQPGGTFILVYEDVKRAGSNPKEKESPFLKDKLRQKYTFDDLEGKPIKTETMLVEYMAANFTVDEVDDAVTAYMEKFEMKPNAAELRKLRKSIYNGVTEHMKADIREGKQPLGAGTVIADFCLPYLCCSDCPPMAFIMPAPKVSLALPVAETCTGTEKLEFKRDPADGEVKAPAGLEATISVADGKTYFLPSKVPAAQLGKTIEFTLNDQLTDCRVIVYKTPEVSLKGSVLKETDDLFTVNFTIKTNQKDPEVFTYIWDLGDGRTQTLTVPELKDITYNKANLKEQGKTGQFDVKLTVKNGPCSTDVLTTIVYHMPEEKVQLAIEPKVCSDNGLVPFTSLVPENGIVESASNPNAIQRNGTQWAFNTALLATGFGTEIKDFTVNGKPADCSLTVYEHPRPAFAADQKPVAGKNAIVVTFTNTTPRKEAFNFEWNLGDGGAIIKGTDAKRTFDMSNFPAGRQLSVSLKAVNSDFNKCIAVTDPPVSITLRPVTRPKNCSDIVSGDLNSGLTILNNLKPKIEEYLISVNDTRKVIVNIQKDFDKIQSGEKNQELIKSLDGIIRPLLTLVPRVGKLSPELGLLVDQQIIVLLDIIRCQAKFSDDPSKRDWLSLLAAINESIGIVKKYSDRLNANNELSIFLKSFLDNFASADPEITEQVNLILAKL